MGGLSVIGAALHVIAAEAVAVGIVGSVALHDRVTGRRTLPRLIRTAAILCGAEAVEVPERESWRPGPLWRWLCTLPAFLAAVAVAVWRGSAEALPMFFRCVIAPGVFVPIVGPVDEATAAVAVGAVALVPSLRAKVAEAWRRTR